MRRASKIAKSALTLFLCIVVYGCGGSGSPPAPSRVLLSSESGSFSNDGSLVGSEALSIKASGNWGPSSTATLETWSTPLVSRSGGTVLPTGYRIQVTDTEAASGNSLVFSINTPVSTEGKFWRLACGRDSSFEVLDVLGRAISTDQVEFDIPQSILKSMTRGNSLEGDFSVAWYTGRPSLEPRLFKNPNYGEQSNFACSPVDDTLVVLSNEDVIQPGERVAIIVHGLNNSADDMPDLAYIASRIVGYFGGNDTYSSEHRYDRIWFFDYHDSATAIDANGNKLAALLNSRGVENAASVDFYGHSMGGLVSRWAIEKNGIGARVDRLFTFGTPHKGVPKPVLGIYGWALSYFIPGIDDLADTSDFIRVLNQNDSPYKNKVAYYALAGSNYDYFWSDTSVILGFGYRVRNWYDVLGWSGPIDGIVAEYSAIPGDLNRFGKSNLRSLATLTLNHSDIGGVPAFEFEINEHPANTSILRALRAMLKSSGSGVIR